jgi:hypothetical protein
MADKRLTTATDAPATDRARPLRCHGCVTLCGHFGCEKESWETTAHTHHAETIANRQSQVWVWLPDTAGGTVRERHIRDCNAIRIVISTPNLDLHCKGYHVPAVRHRDAFYTKLEEDRAKALGN